MNDASVLTDSAEAVGAQGALITPVLLAGGSGTRLWPVSRQSFPKQFADLVTGGSLFQQSAGRMAIPNCPSHTLRGAIIRFQF